MQEYLKGFLAADFKILSDVGRIIEGIFKSWAVLGKIAEEVAVRFAMLAREKLAKLIAIFNETGEISESVMRDLLKNLGAAKDEVEALIRAWLEYTRIQRALKEIEKRRKDIVATYEDEVKAIAASGKSATERVALLRAAMRALIHACVVSGASDLHVTAGARPRVRLVRRIQYISDFNFFNRGRRVNRGIFHQGETAEPG